jgi:methylase of polypeptide subunit release factors
MARRGLSQLIQAWQHVEDFPPIGPRSVFWEPRDTESLRKLIRDTALVHDKTVLEIGTGTGLVALCCLQAGARRVVATDVNAAAIASARYNAQSLELADRLETRLVPLDRPTAFSVIGDEERFDLIISNPPWENRRPNGIDEFALYDEDFRLLESLLHDLPRHLLPGGKALLAYGSVDAIRQV